MIAGLSRALELGGGTHTLTDVLDQIEAGEAQLWRDGDSAIVTEIVIYPRKKVLHFWLVAGELETVIRLSRLAMEWGKGEGCESATGTGRRGWVRALAKEGWTLTHTLISKEL